jgi:Cellulose-binding Sde182, nucleoside hydrolase-like domain/Cellulose-binding protein Sde0182, C-terminal domain
MHPCIKTPRTTGAERSYRDFFRWGKRCCIPFFNYSVVALMLLAFERVHADGLDEDSHPTPTPPPAPPTQQQITAAYGAVDSFRGKPRLIAMNDFGTDDNDNQQYLVRLLLYSNEIDIQGIIPTTAEFQPDTVMPDFAESIIDAYEKVRPNLLKHSPGYPTADNLKRIVAVGPSVFGMQAIGKGKLSPGAQLVIDVVDRPDPRPVWVSVGGGANTLAQALWHVKKTRSRQALADFIAKLRVYTISDQDDSGPWMRQEFPDLFYIVTPSNSNGTPFSQEDFLLLPATWLGISSQGFYEGTGADTTEISEAWLDANIRSKGTYGAVYPPIEFNMEGDTPSWFSLVNNGLNSFRSPSWGGWGGRYAWRIFYGESRPIWTQGITTADTVVGVDGKLYSSDVASIWRWRDAYQNDFSARMDWTIKDFQHANHPPNLVVNGIPGKDYLTINAAVGQAVSLSAAGSSDPDGNQLQYQWIAYNEAGYHAPLRPIPQATVSGANNQSAMATVSSPGAYHIILAVTDNGTPNLTSYRRIIVNATAPR